MSGPPAPTEPRRDVVIDAARAFSVVVVVCFHGALLQPRPTPEGPEIDVLSPGPWGWALSWPLMVLPLFFVCGGYSNSRALRRAADEGRPEVEFLARRARRLLAPLALNCGLGALTATVLHEVGAQRLAAMTGSNLGRLYWFLAVYLGLVILAPRAVALHDRFGFAVLGTLAAASVALGALSPWLRSVIGPWGLDPRMAQVFLVWPLCHQLGIAHERGFLRTSRRQAALALIAGATVCAAGVGLGWFPAAAVGFGDAEGNVTPPTLAMAAVGLSQLGTMTLLQPAIEHLVAPRRLSGAVTALNLLAMTIYLWQVPAIVAAIGLGWLLAGAGATWALHPLVVIAVTWLVLGVTAPWIARIEDWLAPEVVRLRRPWVVVGAVVGFAGTWTVWRHGMTVSPATPLQTVGVVAVLVGTVLLAVGCGGWGTARAGAQPAVR